MPHPQGLLDTLLTHASYALLFAALVAGGMGLPLPEDVVLIAAGVLAHRGILLLPVALAVCAAGVLVGDVVLFGMARRLGPAIFERRFMRRVLTSGRRERIEQMYARHGGKMVFLGRHVGPLRGLVFSMAAIHGMPLRRFLLWDVLSLCSSAPLMVMTGYLSSYGVDQLLRRVHRTEHLVLLGVLAVALLVAGGVWMRGRARRSGA